MPKMTRRALLELGVVAVYSTIRYWADYHHWVEDWQYELTCEDQYRRFLTTEAIRFDSNNYVTNLTHVIAGAFYYQMARTNYLTWKESLLAAFVSSLTYEYVSEWREVISINDMFMTSFGAVSVGEAWFQLSDDFHHSRSPFRRVLAFMNPINEINQFLDRRKPASKALSTNRAGTASRSPPAGAIPPRPGVRRSMPAGSASRPRCSGSRATGGRALSARS